LVEPTPTLDLALDVLKPGLLAAGFQSTGSDDSGTYAWERFRRTERAGQQRVSRVIMVSHAAAERAFLADAYVIARETHIQTPVAREVRRYGAAAEAAATAAALAAVVLTWVEA
jgi:hypothetical protein